MNCRWSGGESSGERRRFIEAQVPESLVNANSHKLPDRERILDLIRVLPRDALLGLLCGAVVRPLGSRK